MSCGVQCAAAGPVVAVAQLVESRVVIPVVVGSSPISHPKESMACESSDRLFPTRVSLAWREVGSTTPLCHSVIGDLLALDVIDAGHADMVFMAPV